MRTRLFPGLFLATLGATAALSPPAVATPSYDGCTGFVQANANGGAYIAASGTWCLDHDLAGALVTTSRIYIDADDVVLDCKGFRVQGDPAQPRANYGVVAYDHNRVAVRHCRIEGFQDGIQVLADPPNGSSILVEDNVLVDNNFAIDLGVTDSLVRRNRVRLAIAGIAGGTRTDLVDNTVDGVSDFGLALFHPRGAQVRGNVVRMPANATGTTTAIRIAGDDLDAANNRAWITGNVVVGAANTVGVECTHAGGRYADNLFTGVPAVALGCADAGDNDSAP